MKREAAAIAESEPSEEHDRGREDETPDPLDATPPGLQDAVLINEIKKALQDLQDQMKKKDQEIDELCKRILVAEDYRKDMEAGIINIKGFDFKTLPKPQKYDMEPKDFEEWFNLFTSMMVAMDPVWDKILEQIMLNESGAKVKKEQKQKDIKAVQKRLGIDERIEKPPTTCCTRRARKSEGAWNRGRVSSIQVCGRERKERKSDAQDGQADKSNEPRASQTCERS